MSNIDHTALRPRRILPVIVLSQFAGTSLWFATNAILPDVQSMWHESSSAIGWMTSAIQLGFILGTLVSAFLNLPDRFSPRMVFCLSSLLGAMFNLCIIVFVESWTLVLLLRVLTSNDELLPIGLRSLVLRRDDFDLITTMKVIIEGNDSSIHLRAETTIADIGVNGESEIHGQWGISWPQGWGISWPYLALRWGNIVAPDND